MTSDGGVESRANRQRFAESGVEGLLRDKATSLAQDLSATLLHAHQSTPQFPGVLFRSEPREQEEPCAVEHSNQSRAYEVGPPAGLARRREPPAEALAHPGH
jgi:hypothetical protein